MTRRMRSWSFEGAPQDIGKQFRIEKEHKEYIDHFGKIGDCSKVSSEKVQLITREHQLLLVPRELCVPRISVKTKPLRNFTSVSQNEKVALLLDYGFWDPEETFPLPSLTLRDLDMLEGGHIKLWALCLTWTFLTLSVFAYEPEFMYEVFDALEGSEEKKSAEGVEKLNR